MACDIQTLLDENPCLSVLNEFQLEVLKTQLLCEIKDLLSGGVSGGAQLVTYTAGTPADPTDTSKPAIAYDPTGTLPMYGWNTDTLTWN